MIRNPSSAGEGDENDVGNFLGISSKWLNTAFHKSNNSTPDKSTKINGIKEVPSHACARLPTAVPTHTHGKEGKQAKQPSPGAGETAR